MARKLASIVEIESCDPIPDTERLSVAKMKGKGWKVVTGRDEFHGGDLAVYFEIDSFLDATDERYAFLKDRCLKKFVSKSGNVLREGIRIKTIKLRGVISQGLIMPLSAFVGKEILVDYLLANQEGVVSEDVNPVSKEELDGVFISTLYYNKEVVGEDGTTTTEKVEVGVGSDLTELLHVEHYDEVKEQLLPLSPQTGGGLCGDAIGSFPSTWIPKSDEERIQQNTEYFDKCKGMTFEITAKDDGTSCTIAFSPSIDFYNPNVVCSRNIRLKRETAAGVVPIYWQMAEKYHILEKLSDLLLEGKEWAVQGEIVGCGIQKNRDAYNECEFHVFRIWDIKNQKFISPDERRKFCEEFEIPHVQVLETHYPFFDKVRTIEEALLFAEGETARGHEREGVVLKQDDGNGDVHLKIISNKYLLSEKD